MKPFHPAKSVKQTFPTLIVRIVVCLILLGPSCSSQAVPRHVYLTWQHDTGTTITVNYQTMEEAETSEVHYDTESRNGKIGDYKFHASGTRHKIETLLDGRSIHWVEL